MNAAVEPVVLNPTRLTRFLRCEYEGYAYAVLRVHLRSRVSSEAANRGKAFHALIEYAIRHYAQTGEVFDFEGDAGQDVAVQVFEDLYDDEGVVFDEDAGFSLLEAARFHIPRLGLSQWEIIEINGEPAIEIDLRAPSGIDGVELQAIVDVVFRHRVTGQIWLVDWKTTALALTTERPPYVSNDYQLALQRRVLRHHGIDVDVSTLVQLRSLSPQLPPLTPKRRKVTRSKDQLACDWKTYARALVDNGEDPNDPKLLDLRNYLDTCVFDRWRHDVTGEVGRKHLDAQINEVCRKLASFASKERQPVRSLQDARIPRSRMCASCDYYKWCKAGLRHPDGVDVSLLAVDYTALPGSPLSTEGLSLAVPFDVDAAYIAYARERGQEITPDQELRP